MLLAKLIKALRKIGPKYLIKNRLIKSDLKLVRLGTTYGGWTFYDSPNLRGSTIVSCGAGEDISFDIELIRHYDASIVIVDPTPRAIAHFSALTESKKNNRSIGINGSNSQLYNLENVDLKRIIWVDRAIWNTQTKLKFYKPKVRSHVSHSLINLQKTDDFIEVETLTASDILKEQNLRHLTMLKMDIEGSEVEVIENLLHDGIFPDQILVEFDEMNLPNSKTYARLKSTLQLLEEKHYLLVHFDGTSNCLFVREDRTLTTEDKYLIDTKL